MPGTSFNIRRLARAEGGLRLRSNASPASSLRGGASKRTLEYYEARRNFASAALETAVVAAFKHAFNTRKQEEGLTQRALGQRCGRWPTSVMKTLRGQNWELSTLSDFAEALDLRFEFAFVDRKQPHRRFTQRGVEYARVDPAEVVLGG